MKKEDMFYAKNNFLKDLIRFLKQRKEIRKQKTFCWCPVCKNDLCSNDSFLSDEENYVRYRCSVCNTNSTWDFNVAPIPFLKKYYVPERPFASI